MSPTVLTKNEIESVASTTGRNTPKAVAGGVRSSACVAIVKPSAPGGSIANASPNQAEGLVTDHLRDDEIGANPSVLGGVADGAAASFPRRPAPGATDSRRTYISGAHRRPRRSRQRYPGRQSAASI